MPIGPHHWKCTELCESVGSNPVFFCGQAALPPFKVLRYAFDWLFHVVSTSPQRSGVEDYVDVLAV